MGRVWSLETCTPLPTGVTSANMWSLALAQTPWTSVGPKNWGGALGPAPYREGAWLTSRNALLPIMLPRQTWSLKVKPCNPRQVVYYTHVPLSPSSIIWYRPVHGQWCSAALEVTAGLTESNGSYQYHRVYGFGHPRADCWGPVSALNRTLMRL